MIKTISFKVKNGVDSGVRVLAVLRRKNFLISEFKISEYEEYAKITISIKDGTGEELNQVVLQMKKLVDVYDIEEKNK